MGINNYEYNNIIKNFKTFCKQKNLQFDFLWFDLICASDFLALVVS